MVRYNHFRISPKKSVGKAIKFYDELVEYEGQVVKPTHYFIEENGSNAQWSPRAAN